jgi:hypothetical protein
VIERGRVPAFRRVAVRAIPCRKRRPRSRVHRIVRLLPGRQVATRIPAVGRRNIQTVVVVEVAGCARHIRMPVRQRKTKRRVIEFPVRPLRDRMAGSARGSRIREAGFDVVRHVATERRG